MLDVLKFVFSSFWVWLGCFFMLYVVCEGAAQVLRRRK